MQPFDENHSNLRRAFANDKADSFLENLSEQAGVEEGRTELKLMLDSRHGDDNMQVLHLSDDEMDDDDNVFPQPPLVSRRGASTSRVGGLDVDRVESAGEIAINVAGPSSLLPELNESGSLGRHSERSRSRTNVLAIEDPNAASVDERLSLLGGRSKKMALADLAEVVRKRQAEESQQHTALSSLKRAVIGMAQVPGGMGRDKRAKSRAGNVRSLDEVPSNSEPVTPRRSTSPDLPPGPHAELTPVTPPPDAGAVPASSGNMGALRAHSMTLLAVNQFSKSRVWEELDDAEVEEVAKVRGQRYAFHNIWVLYYFQAFLGLRPDVPFVHWWEHVRLGSVEIIPLLWRLGVYAQLLCYVFWPDIFLPTMELIGQGNLVEAIRSPPPWGTGVVYLMTYPLAWYLIARQGGFLEMSARWFYRFEGSEKSLSFERFTRYVNLMTLFFICVLAATVTTFLVQYGSSTPVILYVLATFFNQGAMYCVFITHAATLFFQFHACRTFSNILFGRYNVFRPHLVVQWLERYRRLTDCLSKTVAYWNVPLTICFSLILLGITVCVIIVLFSADRSNRIFFFTYYCVFVVCLVLLLLLPARISASFRQVVRRADAMKSNWSDAPMHVAFVSRLALRTRGYTVLSHEIKLASIVRIVSVLFPVGVILFHQLWSFGQFYG